MNTRKIFRNGFIVLIALLPIIYLAYHYNALPQIVPTHFGLNGEADRFSDKKQLWYIVILLSAISLAVYFLINNLSKIDPKKTAKQSTSSFHKISFGLVLFFSTLNIIIVYSAISGSIMVNKLLYPILGLLFIFLGNLMHSIKPNYFVGIRIPWTLENQDNWRVTHRLAGKIWVIGGVVITIATLLLPTKIDGIVFIGIIAVIVLTPIIYSYLYFKKHKQ